MRKGLTLPRRMGRLIPRDTVGGRVEHQSGSLEATVDVQDMSDDEARGVRCQEQRRCGDLFDEIKWRNGPMPLRRWLESIRDFYHQKNPIAVIGD